MLRSSESPKRSVDYFHPEKKAQEKREPKGTVDDLIEAFVPKEKRNGR